MICLDLMAAGAEANPRILLWIDTVSEEQLVMICLDLIATGAKATPNNSSTDW
jgi:hypothetical protein